MPLEVSCGEAAREDRRLFTIIARDVAERQQAENALRAQEERFRIGAQTSSDLLYEWDRVSNFSLRPIDEKLGYEPGDAPHHISTWEKLAHPEDRDRVREAVLRHIKTGAAYREEYRVVGKYGSVHVWMDSGQALRDANGRAVRWIGVVTDVTERRMTEWALKQSDQRLRTLVGNAPVVLFAIDREGIFDPYAGEEGEEVGGLKGEDVGRWFLDLFHDEAAVLVVIEGSARGGILHGDGEMGGPRFGKPVGPFRGSSGEVIGVIGVATDVTEQQRARQAALASEQRYSTLFERNLAGVFRSTLDGRLLDCNDAFARIFGYESREEALAHPATDFYQTLEDRTALIHRLWRKTAP